MLIPLGLGDYDLASVAQHLNVSQVVLLPALPYGFHRSNGDPLDHLALHSGLWRRVLLGVSKELRAQGFRRVFFLTDQCDRKRRLGRRPAQAM